MASVLTVRTTQEVPVETTNMSKCVTKLRIYRSLSEYRVHIESCYFFQETTVKCVNPISIVLWEGYKQVKVPVFLAIVTDQEF